jgi:hypothetical protein
MDELDSPPPEQEPAPQAGDSSVEGQEPSRKTNKSDPERRIQGMMSSLGRRTSERDQARAERDAMQQELLSLRAGLDAALDERAVVPEPEPPESPPPVESEPSAPTSERRYTLAEAEAELQARAPVGHIDANNPHRNASEPSREPSLAELRRQLDDGWAAQQRARDEA